VNTRLDRQAILAPGAPPLLWVVLDEGLLHREVEDSKVMSGELVHLAGSQAGRTSRWRLCLTAQVRTVACWVRS
jgi:hypothetical protein